MTIQSFQSAFHRGMECNRRLCISRATRRRLSVRFSSRHGVQQHFPECRKRSAMFFQSAFHRGMECNTLMGPVNVPAVPFQSAFHRGMECNGQSRRHFRKASIAFSPLFIAAWSATRGTFFRRNPSNPLSVRFSSRHGVQLISGTDASGGYPFSPLFIAAWSATIQRTADAIEASSFSPLFIAAWSATLERGTSSVGAKLSVRFSSRHGVQLFQEMIACGLVLLSVRFSSRHGVQLSSGQALPVSSFPLSVRFSSRHGVQRLGRSLHG